MIRVYREAFLVHNLVYDTNAKKQCKFVDRSLSSTPHIYYSSSLRMHVNTPYIIRYIYTYYTYDDIIIPYHIIPGR